MYSLSNAVGSAVAGQARQHQIGERRVREFSLPDTYSGYHLRAKPCQTSIHNLGRRHLRARSWCVSVLARAGAHALCEPPHVTTATRTSTAVRSAPRKRATQIREVRCGHLRARSCMLSCKQSQAEFSSVADRLCRGKDVQSVSTDSENKGKRTIEAEGGSHKKGEYQCT